MVDVLDRVLDKGLVIAGDIKISLAEVELLTIRIRLIVCSLDKAEQVGLDWWKSDPHLHASWGGDEEPLRAENARLRKQLQGLEQKVAQLTEGAPPRAPTREPRAAPAASSEARARTPQPPRMSSGSVEDKRRAR